MFRLRRDDEIHREEGGWFVARWHFSFDTYRDPEWDGFGPLRVFNDDRLVPGAVWPLHPHRDVEGITYVVQGTFEHADSLGNDGRLPPGGVQRMTLGSGAWHSERNGSPTEPLRFIQLWILPDTPDLPPGVEQHAFSEAERRNRLLRVVGPSDDDPVRVHQDASVHVGLLDPGVEVVHPIGERRGVYVYLVRGAGEWNGRPVETGAAAAVDGEPELRIRATAPSEVVLVDVPLVWTPVGIWAARLR
ncbi:MAG TPA: pirin family protein [Candidatus Limnocylindrales bacterium]|nr:pirin family protein [Candidatus Limnocylindrales bacterium]